MAKRKSPDIDESFKADRAWHTMDLPDIDDVKTLQQQHAYQRILRKKWDDLGYQKPSAILDLPFPSMDAPWWQRPDGLPPEYQRKQIERQMKRLQREQQ
jgi:hypothetical protein